MVAEGVTYTAASTPFLTDICDTVAAGRAARPAHPVLVPVAAARRSRRCWIERAGARARPERCVLASARMTESLPSAASLHRAGARRREESRRPPTAGRFEWRRHPDRRFLTGGRRRRSAKPGGWMVRGAQLFTGYYKRPRLSHARRRRLVSTPAVSLAYMDGRRLHPHQRPGTKGR